VLSEFAELPVCIAYRLPSGDQTAEFPAHQSDFHAAEPVYERLPGWRVALDGRLADAARGYVSFVERELEVEITLVGTGAERERVVALR
jgi:adenylosuccinate synthase